MNNALLIIIPLVLCLTAFAFLFGYTTILLPVKRTEGKTHIACIGDSLTYGCALPLFFYRRYPAVLQRLLGPDYEVAVFAVNDRTLQNSGNKPFRKERAFRLSKEYLPDTVVLLLGTNDSKSSNWISAESFHRQYAELIIEYRNLPSKPRILICTVPYAFSPSRLFSFITTKSMVSCIPQIADEIKKIAESESAELIDLFALTEGKKELFGPDGLHPSPEGARIIAKKILESLCAPQESASN